MRQSTLRDTVLARDLISVFDHAAARFPERVALSAEDRVLTYRQLDEWSNGVTRLLRASGVRTGDRVALRLAASAEAVAVMLGILKAGAAYVPLDVRNPPARNELILADSGVRVLVGAAVDGFAGATIAQEDITGLLGIPAPRPESGLPGPDHEAYVIYTSGTTGRPKGVPVQHRHVVSLFAGAAEVFEFTAEDRWLLFHSISFDFSVWEIWGALSTGATLVVLPHWAARTPEQYLQVLVDERISVLNQTPTAFAALADAAVRLDTDLPHLRYVIFGGERLLAAALRPWAQRYGLAGPRLVNGYGITETTVFTTFHPVDESDLTRSESIIGAPLPGFQLRIVRDDGQDAEGAEVGELWLAGPQVTTGYLHRPDLNAERFPTITDPLSGAPVQYYRSGDLVSRTTTGELVFHGRADLQVKLRGYRIELSDIESALCKHPAVADAVVFVRDFKSADSRLVAGLVVRDGQSLTVRELREHIKELLPSYMHPARYVRLRAMPRTVNGKVDRTAVVEQWEEGTVIT